MPTDLIKQANFPPAGKYVLAVSGGVDSVVLLDLINCQAKEKNYQLIVAHFDHGMRPDSKEDLEFVRRLANKYRLKFESAAGKLGKKATEERAREARYNFLNRVSSKYKADKIVTAHHLDDALETAIFNAGRGVDYLGLTPLHLNVDIARPLLNIRKAELEKYAKSKKLMWREDPTNQDLSITRNFIRQVIMPDLSSADVKSFLRQVELNRQALAELEELLDRLDETDKKSVEFKRIDLLVLNSEELKGLLRLAVNKLGGSVEKVQLERLAIFCKTAKPKRSFAVSQKLRANSQSDKIVLLEKTAS